MEDIDRKPLNIKLLSIGALAVIVIVVLIVILAGLLRENPYGPEIKINNYDEFLSDIPKSKKDLLFANLYIIAYDNSDQNAEIIPKEGAFIRDGSVNITFDEETQINEVTFIVDIPSIKQSYSGYTGWSVGGASEVGYDGIYSCLRLDQLIYGDFDCKDMFSDDISTLFPIVTELPITVSEYSNNYTKYVKFSISYTINDDHSDITLVINDYVGNGHEDALQKIRDLGYDPDDYEIDYKNVSSEYEMNYVGN